MLHWHFFKLILELVYFFTRHHHRISMLLIVATCLLRLCHLSFHEILVQFVNINFFIILRWAIILWNDVFEAVPLQAFDLDALSQVFYSLVASLGLFERCHTHRWLERFVLRNALLRRQIKVFLILKKLLIIFDSPEGVDWVLLKHVYCSLNSRHLF